MKQNYFWLNCGKNSINSKVAILLMVQVVFAGTLASGREPAWVHEIDSASIWNHNGDFSKAAKKFRSKLKVHADSVGLHRQYQDAAFAAGDSLRSDAIAYYEKLLESNKRNKVFRYLYGRCVPCSEGASHFDTALILDSCYAWAMIGRGACFAESRDFSSAKTAFLLAISCNPDIAEAYRNLALLYVKEGDSSRAVQVFRKLIARNRKNPAAYELLGDMYLDGQKYALARQAYEKTVTYDTHSPSGLFKAGYSAFMLNDFAAADEYYGKSIQAGNRKYEVYFNRAAALEQAGKWEQALDGYRYAHKLSGNTEIFYSMGNCSVMLGLHSKAIQCYDAFLVERPDHAEGLFGLANAYQLKRDYARAVDIYKKVIYKNSSFAKAYYNLGSIYAYHQKDAKKMAEYWKKFLSLAKDSEEIAIINKEMERIARAERGSQNAANE